MIDLVMFDRRVPPRAPAVLPRPSRFRDAPRRCVVAAGLAGAILGASVLASELLVDAAAERHVLDLSSGGRTVAIAIMTWLLANAGAVLTLVGIGAVQSRDGSRRPRTFRPGATPAAGGVAAELAP